MIFIPNGKVKFTKLIQMIRRLQLETGGHEFSQISGDVFKFRSGIDGSEIFISRIFPNSVLVDATEIGPRYGALAFLRILTGVSFVSENSPLLSRQKSISSVLSELTS